ncbi:MAG TPA: 2'-5' RNA ligase family protein [Vicinamibacteria bacterium]|nr:2'-5' RNA ligase family protein [Vicinamibacteria bacterium]
MGTGARGSGFSLWVMPEGEIGTRLLRWIDTLAVRFRTERFPPHLTVLSGLDGTEAEVLRGAAAAAASLEPFTVHVDGVDGRDEHFRCLFVQALEAAPLAAAHTAAAHVFGRQPDPAYQPHLSLVYGTVDPATKLAVAHEASSEVASRFAARRLHVWRTDGPVPDWREVGVFEIGRPVPAL